MTEKRFKLIVFDDGDNVIEDTINGDAYGFNEYYHQYIVDKLNEQDQQIQDLKDENATLKAYITDLHEQYEEAHGLSIRNSEWYDD